MLNEVWGAGQGGCKVPGTECSVHLNPRPLDPLNPLIFYKMIPDSTHNIAIIDKNYAHRDYLRSLLTGWGYTSLGFEKETLFLENCAPLKPNLVIAVPPCFENASRLIHALKLINGATPAIIMTDDDTIHDFVQHSGFNGIRIVRADFKLHDARLVVKDLIDKFSEKKSDSSVPIIVGMSPNIKKLKEKIRQLSRLSTGML
jgi:DNA-binding NtrC family response regulator